MDGLIDNFIQTYTDDFQVEIHRAFSIFESFEHNNAYQGFNDILMNESNLTTDMMHDQFTQELHEQLNFVLKQHSIQLVESATIYEKNEICTALFSFQNLEDYTGIIRTLESFDPDEAQLSWILGDLCALNESQILSLLETFNPRMLKTMKMFIYKKEESQGVPVTLNEKLMKNLRLFSQVFGAETLGAQLVRSQILVGERFETYLDYIQDVVVGKDPADTAMNLLSVIFISSDGFNSPLTVFRKSSYQILQDLDLVTKVESQMLSLIAKLDEYKQAESERVRLEQTHIEVNQGATQ